MSTPGRACPLHYRYRPEVFTRQPELRADTPLIDNVFVDAIKVHYDHQALVEQFETDWPAGSPAFVSYLSQILHGLVFNPGHALGTRSDPKFRKRA